MVITAIPDQPIPATQCRRAHFASQSTRDSPHSSAALCGCFTWPTAATRARLHHRRTDHMRGVGRRTVATPSLSGVFLRIGTAGHDGDIDDSLDGAALNTQARCVFTGTTSRSAIALSSRGRRPACCRCWPRCDENGPVIGMTW